MSPVLDTTPKLEQANQNDQKLEQVRSELESLADVKVDLDFKSDKAQKSFENLLVTMVNKRGEDVAALENEYRNKTEPKTVLTRIQSLAKKAYLPAQIQNKWFSLGQTVARSLHGGAESVAESVSNVKYINKATEFVKDNLTYDPVVVLKELSSNVFADYAQYPSEKAVREAITHNLINSFKSSGLLDKKIKLATGKSAALLNTLVSVGNYDSNTGQALIDVEQSLKTGFLAPRLAGVIESLTKRVLTGREIAASRMAENKTLRDQLVDRASTLIEKNKGETFGPKAGLSPDDAIATFGVGTVSMLNGLVVSSAGEKLTQNYEYQTILGEKIAQVRDSVYSNEGVKKLLESGKFTKEQIDLVVNASATKLALETWMRIADIRLQKNESFTEAEKARKMSRFGLGMGVLNSVIGRQQWEILKGDKINSESELINILFAAEEQAKSLEVATREQGALRLYQKVVGDLSERIINDKAISELNGRLVEQKTKVTGQTIKKLAFATGAMAGAMALSYVAYRPGMALIGETGAALTKNHFKMGGQTYDGTFNADLGQAYASGIYYQQGLTGKEAAVNATIGLSMRLTAGVAPMLTAGRVGFYLAENGGEIVHNLENMVGTAGLYAQLELDKASIATQSFMQDRMAMGNHVFEHVNASGQRELIVNLSNPNDLNDATYVLGLMAKKGDIVVVQHHGEIISRNQLAGNDQGKIDINAIQNNILNPARAEVLHLIAANAGPGSASAAEIPDDVNTEDQAAAEVQRQQDERQRANQELLEEARARNEAKLAAQREAEQQAAEQRAIEQQKIEEAQRQQAAAAQAEAQRQQANQQRIAEHQAELHRQELEQQRIAAEQTPPQAAPTPDTQTNTTPVEQHPAQPQESAPVTPAQEAHQPTTAELLAQSRGHAGDPEAIAQAEADLNRSHSPETAQTATAAEQTPPQAAPTPDTQTNTAPVEQHPAQPQESAPVTQPNSDDIFNGMPTRDTTLRSLREMHLLRPGDTIRFGDFSYTVPQRTGAEFNERAEYNRFINELNLRGVDRNDDLHLIIVNGEHASDPTHAVNSVEPQPSTVSSPDTNSPQQTFDPANEGILQVDPNTQLVRATYVVGGRLDLRGFNPGELVEVPEGQTPEKLEATATNGDQVYQLGDRILLSSDGGQTFHDLPITQQRVQVVAEDGTVSWQTIQLRPDQVGSDGRPDLEQLQRNTYEWARANNVDMRRLPDLDMYMPPELLQQYTTTPATAIETLSYARIIPGRGIVFVDPSDPNQRDDINAGVSMLEYLRNSNRIAGAEADIQNQGATSEVLRTILENPRLSIEDKARILGAILATSQNDHYTELSNNNDLALTRNIAENLRSFGITEDGYDHMRLTTALAILGTSDVEVNERSLRLRIVEEAERLKHYSNPRFTELANLNRPLSDAEQDEFNRFVRSARNRLDPTLRDIRFNAQSNAEEMAMRRDYYRSIRDGMITEGDKAAALTMLQTIQTQQELLGNQVEIAVDPETGIPYISRFVNSFGQDLDPGVLTSEAHSRTWIDPLGTLLTFLPNLTGGFGGGIVIKEHDWNNFASQAPGVSDEFIERAVGRAEENMELIHRSGLSQEGIQTLSVVTQLLRFTGIPFGYFAQSTEEHKGTYSSDYQQILTEGRQNLQALSESNPTMIRYAMLVDYFNHPSDYSEGSAYAQQHPEEAAQLRDAAAQFSLGDRLISNPDLRAAIDQKLSAGGTPQGALLALQREGYINPTTGQPLTADDIAAATTILTVQAQASLYDDGSRSIVPGANPTGLGTIDRVGVTFGRTLPEGMINLDNLQADAKAAMQENIDRTDNFIARIDRAVDRDPTPATVLGNMLPNGLDASSRSNIVSTFLQLRNTPNAQPVTIHTNLGDVVLRPGNAGNLGLSNVLGAQYVADDGTGHAGGNYSYLSRNVGMVEIDFTQRNAAQYRDNFDGYPDRIAALTHCAGNIFGANRNSLDLTVPVAREAHGLDRDTPPSNANVTAVGVQELATGSSPNDLLRNLSDLQRVQNEIRQTTATNMLDSFRNSIISEDPLSYEEWEKQMIAANPDGFDPESGFLSLRPGEAPMTLRQAYEYFQAHPNELNRYAAITQQQLLDRNYDRRATITASISGNSFSNSMTQTGPWTEWTRATPATATSSTSIMPDGSTVTETRTSSGRFERSRDTTRTEESGTNINVSGSYDSHSDAVTRAVVTNVIQATVPTETGAEQFKQQNAQSAVLNRTSRTIAGVQAQIQQRDSSSETTREQQERERTTYRRTRTPGETPETPEIPRGDLPDTPPIDDTPGLEGTPPEGTGQIGSDGLPDGAPPDENPDFGLEPGEGTGNIGNGDLPDTAPNEGTPAFEGNPGGGTSQIGSGNLDNVAPPEDLGNVTGELGNNAPALPIGDNLNDVAAPETIGNLDTTLGSNINIPSNGLNGMDRPPESLDFGF
ncbi:MAG: hypothetical protein OHK0017_09830 [Patescibacteria group bacterium]